MPKGSLEGDGIQLPPKVSLGLISMSIEERDCDRASGTF